jgi:hypothetical protein
MTVNEGESKAAKVASDDPPADANMASPSQSHNSYSTSKEVPETVREVCRLFLRGRCFYGTRCRYLHSREHLENAATNTVDSIVSPGGPESTIYAEISVYHSW